MSAIYQDDHYTSKIDSPGNSRKRLQIDELFTNFATLRTPGDYEIRWQIKDGAIGEITTRREKLGGTHPNADVRASIHALQLDIDKLHKNTCNVGFTGCANVSWTIKPDGTLTMKSKVEQNFR